MSLYAAIDLHSNNGVLSIIDGNDRVQYEHLRIPVMSVPDSGIPRYVIPAILGKRFRNSSVPGEWAFALSITRW
jgi:hypothetical protein